LRLRKKSQANQPKGKALPTLELNGESKGDSNVGSKGDSTGIYGMLKGALGSGVCHLTGGYTVNA
jgi:hypothetical protein